MQKCKCGNEKTKAKAGLKDGQQRYIYVCNICASKKETHQRGLHSYPRKFYYNLFIAECHRLHAGKTTHLNNILYSHYENMSVLEKDRLHILFSQMTPEQKKNPKLLPGE